MTDNKLLTLRWTGVPQGHQLIWSKYMEFHLYTLGKYLMVEVNTN